MSSLDEELSEECESEALHSYYQDLNSPEVQQSVRNFDKRFNYDQLCKEVNDGNSKNFLIDYGDNHAYCAFNLSAQCIRDLVKAERPPELKTRWINIWVPYQQPEILKVLAKQYQFSPRLLGFMLEKPIEPAQIAKSPKCTLKSEYSENSQESTIKNIWGRNFASRDSPSNKSHDPEQYACERKLPNEVIQPSSDNSDKYYYLVDRVWHWTAFDWGRKYVCISYNSLYGNESRGYEDVDDETRDHGRPNVKRIWTWLFLLMDGTVISVTEDPYPYHNDSYSSSQNKMIATIRYNLANIFKQLSKQCDISRMNPIKILPLRKRHENVYAESIHEPEDAPSLLFYSLFDDWAAAYRLITRKEDQYGAELDKMRRQMLQNADLEHADQFYYLGRQLTTLKRLYQGYELLIERLLEKRDEIVVSVKNKPLNNDEHFLQRSETSISKIPAAETSFKVTLSAAARVRFERLRDRIRLYALSEIQDCLDEKESLVKMNFNLIAIKESRLVERFTRAALVLTKITILFLPVTVMSSYFSADLVDTQFTVRTFWTAFGIVLGSSLILIFAFGAYSGTMEEDLNHKPLSKRLWDISRNLIPKTRKRNKSI